MNTVPPLAHAQAAPLPTISVSQPYADSAPQSSPLVYPPKQDNTLTWIIGGLSTLALVAAGVLGFRHVNAPSQPVETIVDDGKKALQSKVKQLEQQLETATKAKPAKEATSQNARSLQK